MAGDFQEVSDGLLSYIYMRVNAMPSYSAVQAMQGLIELATVQPAHVVAGECYCNGCCRVGKRQ